MVWLLEQPFSCFGCFKIHARLGIGLVGHVGTVTTLGRSAPPHWSRMHALLRMAGHGCLWPGYGLAAASPAALSSYCCRLPCPAPRWSHCRHHHLAIMSTLLTCLVLLLPMPLRCCAALSLALSSHARGLSRLPRIVASP